MTEPSRCFDITITVDSDGSNLPHPARFFAAVEEAASDRAVSIMSAHTARRIISVVTVQAVDQLTAAAVALAVVSDALRHPVASPTR